MELSHLSCFGAPKPITPAPVMAGPMNVTHWRRRRASSLHQISMSKRIQVCSRASSRTPRPRMHAVAARSTQLDRSRSSRCFEVPQYAPSLISISTSARPPRRHVWEKAGRGPHSRQRKGPRAACAPISSSVVESAAPVREQCVHGLGVAVAVTTCQRQPTGPGPVYRHQHKRRRSSQEQCSERDVSCVPDMQ